MAKPDHALGRLESACQRLLSQEISVVEWSVQFAHCERDLEQLPLPQILMERSRACLETLKSFATGASLSQLDQGLADLQRLLPQWDHWWWVARRSGPAWPSPSQPAEDFRVLRQSGRSRISWNCPTCDWSLSWDLETAAWEVVDWPGTMECPMGCAPASSDGRPSGENLPSESGN